VPSRVRSVAEALVAVGAGLGVVAALVVGSIYLGLRGTESFDTRVDPPAQPAAGQRSEIDAARTCDALGRLLTGATVGEVVWALTYLAVDESKPWIWLPDRRRTWNDRNALDRFEARRGSRVRRRRSISRVR
jgi:hypothetical protein